MPWYSGPLSLIPWFSRVQSWPESGARTAWRGWMTGILLWVPLGIPWCVSRVTTDAMSAISAIAMWILMACLSFGFLVPTLGLIGSLHGAYGLARSRRRAIFYGVVGCLAPVPVCAAIQTYISPNLSVLTYLLGVIMTLGVLLASCTQTFRKFVRDDVARDEHVGEWEQLELAE